MQTEPSGEEALGLAPGEEEEGKKKKVEIFVLLTLVLPYCLTVP